MNKLTCACIALAMAASSDLAFADNINPVSPGGTLIIDNSYTVSTPGSVAPGNMTINDVSPNGSGGYRYSDGWGSSQTTISATGVPSNTYSFYDDFVFKIQGSQANSITSVINLGDSVDLQNLDVQLFALSNTNSLPYLTGSGMSDADGVTHLTIDVGGTGTVEVLRTMPNAPLNAGTYVLQVRGQVDGSAGGNYTGTLNITPVPIPAAGWLLLSAVGGLAATSRRRTELALA